MAAPAFSVSDLIPLHRILASKRAANHRRDRLAIPVLADSLAAQPGAGEELDAPAMKS